MAIQLVKDAADLLNKQVQKREFQAAKLSTEQQAREGHVNLFSQAMQALVTKTGLIVSSIVEKPKMERPRFASTYLGALDYLSTLLKDPSIEKHMRIIQVNDNANNMKHSLKDTINLNIKDCVEQYNVVIKKLQSSLNLNGFKAFLLNLNAPNPAKNLFKDKPAEKAFTLGKHNVKIKLRCNRAKDYDEYRKVMKVHMIVCWNNGNGNGNSEKILCEVASKARNIGTYKAELNKGTKSEEKDMFQKDITLDILEKDIEGSAVKLSVSLELQQMQPVTKTRMVAVKKFLRTKYEEQEYTENCWVKLASKKIDISTVIR